MCIIQARHVVSFREDEKLFAFHSRAFNYDSAVDYREKSRRLRVVLRTSVSALFYVWRVSCEPTCRFVQRAMKASIDETDSMINNLACHRCSMLIRKIYRLSREYKLNSDDPTRLSRNLLVRGIRLRARNNQTMKINAANKMYHMDMSRITSRYCQIHESISPDTPPAQFVA